MMMFHKSCVSLCQWSELILQKNLWFESSLMIICRGFFFFSFVSCVVFSFDFDEQRNIISLHSFFCAVWFSLCNEFLIVGKSRFNPLELGELTDNLSYRKECLIFMWMIRLFCHLTGWENCDLNCFVGIEVKNGQILIGLKGKASFPLQILQYFNKALTCPNSQQNSPKKMFNWHISLSISPFIAAKILSTVKLFSIQ